MLSSLLITTPRQVSAVQTVDVPFTSRTSAPKSLYIVRGYVLHLHGTADHNLKTTFTIRMDGRTLATGQFKDEWRLDVPTGEMQVGRGYITVSFSRGRVEEPMGRIELEVADKTPFAVQDLGAEGFHRRKVALSNASRLSPAVVRWRCTDQKVQVTRSGDGFCVEMSGAKPGRYGVDATITVPGNVSYTAETLMVEVPERIGFQPEGPTSIPRNLAVEREPFRIPLRFDINNLTTVEVKRNGVIQPGTLSLDKKEFLLDRIDVMEGEGRWTIRAVAADGAEYLSNERTIETVSAPEYLKHRVLKDCLVRRDSVREAVNGDLAKAVSAHEIVSDLPSALNASRLWAATAATLRDRQANASLPNTLGLTKEQGEGWITGASGIFANWSEYLGKWIDGMAVACAPIAFDKSPASLSSECRRRVDAIRGSRGSLRDADREGEALDLALIRLAEEAGDPRPEKTAGSGPRLKDLDSRIIRQEEVLMWLSDLYGAISTALPGNSLTLPSAAQRVAKIVPPKRMTGVDRENAQAAIVTYARMLKFYALVRIAEEEHAEIRNKYVLYPRPLTAVDQNRLFALRKEIDANNALASMCHRQAFDYLSAGLAGYGVPMMI